MSNFVFVNFCVCCVYLRDLITRARTGT